MTKKKKEKTVTAYVDLEFYERIQTVKSEREKLSPPGWKSQSEWAGHLLEEGLKVEEKTIKKLKLEKKRDEEEVES
jgi:hypothetical protein